MISSFSSHQYLFVKHTLDLEHNDGLLTHRTIFRFDSKDLYMSYTVIFDLGLASL